MGLSLKGYKLRVLKFAIPVFLNLKVSYEQVPHHVQAPH